MRTDHLLADALRALSHPQNFRADPTAATLGARDAALLKASQALALHDQRNPTGATLVAYTDTLPLTAALFWFIENAPEEGEARHTLFFHLRERVRAHTEPAEPLTTAYVAIGAAREIDSRGGLPSTVSDAHSGELGFIDSCLHDAHELDTAASVAHDDLTGVFSYDVAESYGAEVAAALLDGKEPDRAAIRARLIAEACQ